MHGCTCCVVSGGQKYVQRTSAYPNHSALTFKAVTKSPLLFCTLQKQVATKLAQIANFVQMAFETNFFQGISTYAYANHKHFFAEGLHKLLYARNI